MARKKKSDWAAVYLLVSPDAKELALVTLANEPVRFTEFLQQLEAWLSIMKQKGEINLLDDEEEIGGVQ